MEVANLIIDIGNTAVKTAWCDGMTLGKTFRYQGERVLSFILSVTEKEKPSVMVVSSVYEISKADEEALAKECARLIILDSAHTDISRSKMLPGWLGYDRVASIIAARYLFRNKGVTIVDIGTTIGIDFIGPDGTYQGGNLTVGCRTRFKAINRYAKAIPLVNTPDDTPLIGNSFETSVTSGIISGIVFEIEGYVSLHPDNVVVFTGGDAIYFAKRMKNSIFVVCNLVLIGLAIIADEYAKEND